HDTGLDGLGGPGQPLRQDIQAGHAQINGTAAGGGVDRPRRRSGSTLHHQLDAAGVDADLAAITVMGALSHWPPPFEAAWTIATMPARTASSSRCQAAILEAVADRSALEQVFHDILRRPKVPVSSSCTTFGRIWARAT